MAAWGRGGEVKASEKMAVEERGGRGGRGRGRIWGDRRERETFFKEAVFGPPPESLKPASAALIWWGSLRTPKGTVSY